MSEHELWNELGNLYFMSGTYNQAAYAYNRSIQLESGFGRPYCNLALTYVKQGKFQEAVSLYQRSIELLVDEKEKAITWYRLGDVYRHLKDYRDAIMAYQQADELDANMSQECKDSQQVLYGGSGSNLSAAAQAAAAAIVSNETAAAAPMDSTVTLTETAHFQDIQPEIQLAELELEQASPCADLAPGPDEVEELEAAPSEPVNETDVTHELVPPVAETVSELALPDPAWIDDEQLFSSFEAETEVYIPDFTDEQMHNWPAPEEPELPLQAEPEGMQHLVPEPALVASDWQPADPPAQAQEMRRQEIPMPPVAELEIDIPDEQLASMFIIPGEQQLQPEVQEEPLVEPAPAAQAAEDLQEIESEITKFRQVVQANPRNAAAWDTLGTLYKSARKYRDAILAYQQAVAMDPAKAPYHHHLGIIYSIEGREEDAMKAFQEVIELDPNHSLANATLGGYYRKMGLEELAQRHIGKAMKNFYNSENEYNRACLEALCGNIEQSIELLRIALKNKQTYVDWVLRDPDLDSIRRDPRFKQLISDYTA